MDGRRQELPARGWLPRRAIGVRNDVADSAGAVAFDDQEGVFADRGGDVGGIVDPPLDAGPAAGCNDPEAVALDRQRDVGVRMGVAACIAGERLSRKSDRAALRSRDPGRGVGKRMGPRDRRGMAFQAGKLGHHFGDVQGSR